MKTFKKFRTIFFLYLILIYSFFYINKYNNFSLKIFLKSFQEFEITNNFPINNKYFESINLLKNNNINFFSLSEKIYSDEYLRFKIIVTNYPKKFDPNSTYLISFADEVLNSNCITVEKKVFLKIIECQK
jgi:hypothetical protein